MAVGIQGVDVVASRAGAGRCLEVRGRDLSVREALRVEIVREQTGEFASTMGWTSSGGAIEVIPAAESTADRLLLPLESGIADLIVRCRESEAIEVTLTLPMGSLGQRREIFRLQPSQRPLVAGWSRSRRTAATAGVAAGLVAVIGSGIMLFLELSGSNVTEQESHLLVEPPTNGGGTVVRGATSDSGKDVGNGGAGSVTDPVAPGSTGPSKPDIASIEPTITEAERLIENGELNQGIAMLRKLALSGDVSACFALARSYDPSIRTAEGVNGRPSMQSAFNWYSDCETRGHPRARQALNRLRLWVEARADAGDEEARTLLSFWRH